MNFEEAFDDFISFFLCFREPSDEFIKQMTTLQATVNDFKNKKQIDRHVVAMQ